MGKIEKESREEAANKEITQSYFIGDIRKNKECLLLRGVHIVAGGL